MFSAVVAFALLSLSPKSFAAEVHGVLQVVKGDVQVKSSKDGKTSKAKVGGKVYPKDTIITAKDSRAKIVMVDNNVLNVSPETSLEIQNYEYAPEQGKKDVLLNVLYGKVRSKVEQKYDDKTSKFQLKTPTAVAGVRGTDFMAGYAPPTAGSSGPGVSTVVTFEGSVMFGTPGPNGTIMNPVAVTPGLMTQISNNTPAAAPKPVPLQDLAAMDRESKAETATNTPTPSNDPRTPAGDNRGSSNSRGPASPGATMLLESDKAGAPDNKAIPIINELQPQAPNVPVVNAVPNQEPCPNCKEITTNGNSMLHIRVNH